MPQKILKKYRKFQKLRKLSFTDNQISMSALNCRVVEMKTNKVKSQPRMLKPLVAAIPSELTGLNKHFQKRGSDK